MFLRVAVFIPFSPPFEILISCIKCRPPFTTYPVFFAKGKVGFWNILSIADRLYHKDFLKATEIGFFYNQYIDEIYRTPKNIEIINLTYRILEYILVMV